MTSQVSSFQQFPPSLLARLNQVQNVVLDLQKRIGFNENGVVQVTNNVTNVTNEITQITQQLTQTDQYITNIQNDVTQIINNYVDGLVYLEDFAVELAQLTNDLDGLQNRVILTEQTGYLNGWAIEQNQILTESQIDDLYYRIGTYDSLITLHQNYIDDLFDEIDALTQQLNDDISDVYFQLDQTNQLVTYLLELDDFQALQIAYIMLRELLHNYVFPITRKITISGYRNILTGNPTSLLNLSGYSLMSVLVPPSGTYPKLSGGQISSQVNTRHYYEDSQTPIMFRLSSGTYTLHATLEYQINPNALKTTYYNFLAARSLTHEPAYFIQFATMLFEVTAGPASLFRGEDSSQTQYRLAYSTQFMPWAYGQPESIDDFAVHKLSISLTTTFEILTSSNGSLDYAQFYFYGSFGNGINYQSLTGSNSTQLSGRVPLKLTYTLDRKSSPDYLYTGYTAPGGSSFQTLFANPHLNGLYLQHIV